MIDFKKILELKNRGILIDVVVFLFNLTLMRILVVLCLNIVDRAETDVLAKLGVGLFFAGLFFLQPLGPILKRWSFHQRYKSFELGNAGVTGCLLFWYMFFYIIIMLIVCGAAVITLSEVVFERGSEWSEIGVVFLLAGFVLCFVNAVIIFRYFLKPKKEPHWKFLTTPQAEVLGDISMFLNIIGFQIFWGCITASALFWESMNPTSHGQSPGWFGRTFFRFFVIGAFALLIYFPPRIFYLVIDQRRKITWLTMLLANLPLIVGIVIYSPRAKPATVAGPTSRVISGKSSFIVTAEDFYKEYKLDSPAGAKTYAGKYVTVTGRVQSVDMNQGNSVAPAVRLEGGGRMQWVICRFDNDQNDDQKEQMHALQKNQLVTLQGTGARFWIGGPTLEHCVLVNAR